MSTEITQAQDRTEYGPPTSPRTIELRGPLEPKTLRFDWTLALLTLWPVLGAYLDGWAHIHRPELESFFTPWHGVLYSGFLAVALFTAAAVVRGRRAGVRWTAALPAGHETAPLGVLLFAAGGVGDMVWHLLFGIELGVDALLSPTHLALAVGMGLIAAGPLRAFWLRRREGEHAPDWGEAGPGVLALGLVWALLVFMTQYAHPFGYLWPARAVAPGGVVDPFDGRVFFPQAMGVLGVMLQSAILVGLLLATLRRRALPAGSLTLVVTAGTALLVLMRWRLIVTGPIPMIAAALAGGVAGDLLLVWLRPGPARPGSLRTVAFAVPALLYAAYFLTILITQGTWWTVHLVTGAIVSGGLTGWLLSYLVVPAAAPAPPPV